MVSLLHRATINELFCAEWDVKTSTHSQSLAQVTMQLVTSHLEKTLCPSFETNLHLRLMWRTTQAWCGSIKHS